MAWTTFRLTVTTPLFNYGEPDTGLRAASLRGAMHQWFRALAATRAGNDIRALAAAEQEVFGSTKKACPVRIRLSGQPDRNRISTKPEHPAFLSGEKGAWVAYLLGQGHASYDTDLEQGRTTRPYTKTGHSFALRLGFSGNEAIDSLFLASLWLTCTYGGLGARTRKGFGGARLTYEKGELPELWRNHSPNTPGLEHYEGLKHLPLSGAIGESEACLEELMPARKADSHQKAPVYPALGQGNTIAALSSIGGAEWWEVAAEAGERYRRFRATERHAALDPGYSPPLKTPEHLDVVHGQGRHFPLGALGLPVNYPKEANVNAFKGKESMRRASPLWLRFVNDAEGQEWRLFSFAFLNPFLPEGSGLRVRATGNAIEEEQGRTLHVRDTDVRERARRWMELTSAQDFA